MKKKIAVWFICFLLVMGQEIGIYAETVPDISYVTEIPEKTDSSEGNMPVYKEDEVIIVYEDEMADMDKVEEAIETDQKHGLDETEQALVDLGISEQKEIVSENTADTGSVAVATLPEDVSVKEAMNELEDTENVSYVQKNYVYQTQGCINDAKRADAYYLNNLNLEKAWEKVRADRSSYNKSGSPITVAVLDSGISYAKGERHEELQDVNSGGNIWYSYAYDAYRKKKMSTVGTDWYDPSGTFTDYIGHGTMVSSLIAAQANNQKGIAGTSYNGRVLPVNIFECPHFSEDNYIDVSGKYYAADAYATSDALISGYNYVLKYADKLNIKVVNLSIGSPSKDSALRDCINRAYAKGILTVSSAGNDYSSDKMYPASYDHVVSVASVDSMNRHSIFSQYNDSVDISAPGEFVLVPAAEYISDKSNRLYWYKTNRYTNLMSGTSFSSPIVSGIAALLYAADPHMTPDKAEKYLKTTATDITETIYKKGLKGKDNYYGYGVVDAYKAVSAALGEKVESSVSKTDPGRDLIPDLSLWSAKKVSSASLSSTTYTYSGHSRTPLVTAKSSKTSLSQKSKSSNRYVKLSYSSGRTKVGLYRVKATGRYKFTGTVTKTFKIVPKSTKIRSVSKRRKAFKVTWSKQKSQTSGYQIRYSRKSNMSKAKVKSIRSNKYTSKTITGLRARTKYYVQVRTYKKIGGKNYFSNWSSRKSVKTQ